VTEHTPAFSEAELLSVYEDLLRHPEDGATAVVAPDTEPQDVRDARTLDALHTRLVADLESELLEPAPAESRPRLSETLQARRDGTLGSSDTEDALHAEAQPMEAAPSIEAAVGLPLGGVNTRSVVLARVAELVAGLERLQGVQLNTAVPVSLLSTEEWEALTRTCIAEQDGNGMEATLAFMKVGAYMHRQPTMLTTRVQRTGVEPSEDILCTSMKLYADVGDVARTEAFMSLFLTGRSLFHTLLQAPTD
jgi:hypothetical protein